MVYKCVHMGIGMSLRKIGRKLHICTLRLLKFSSKKIGDENGHGQCVYTGKLTATIRIDRLTRNPGNPRKKQ